MDGIEFNKLHRKKLGILINNNIYNNINNNTIKIQTIESFPPDILIDQLEYVKIKIPDDAKVEIDINYKTGHYITNKVIYLKKYKLKDLYKNLIEQEWEILLRRNGLLLKFLDKKTIKMIEIAYDTNENAIQFIENENTRKYLIEREQKRLTNNKAHIYDPFEKYRK
jgi:hypothetical protein